MSTWRLLLRDMSDAGGDDLRISQLPGWGITRETARGRETLLAHALIAPSSTKLRHSITPRGWRVATGAADIVEPRGSGLPGHRLRSYALVVRGDSVPDVVIEDLLIGAGFVPGVDIGPDVIREYSARLAAVVRASIT